MNINALGSNLNLPRFAAKKTRVEKKLNKPSSQEASAQVLIADYSRAIRQYRYNCPDAFALSLNEQEHPDGSITRDYLFGHRDKQQVIAFNLPDGKLVQLGAIIRDLPKGWGRQKDCFFDMPVPNQATHFQSWSPYIQVFPNQEEALPPAVYFLDSKQSRTKQSARLALVEYSKSRQGRAMPSKEVASVLPPIIDELQSVLESKPKLNRDTRPRHKRKLILPMNGVKTSN